MQSGQGRGGSFCDCYSAFMYLCDFLTACNYVYMGRVVLRQHVYTGRVVLRHLTALGMMEIFE